MPTLTDRELEELKASVDCCVENGISRVNVPTSDLSKLLASYEERGRALAVLYDRSAALLSAASACASTAAPESNGNEVRATIRDLAPALDRAAASLSTSGGGE